MEEKQYYGPSEVYSKVEADGYVTATLKRETSEELYDIKVPTVVFERVVTNEAKDWNYVQQVKLQAATNDIIEVLTNHGITGGEFKPLLNFLTLSFFNIIDRALNYQFTGNDKSFVPGGDLYFDFTLNRAHEITKDLDGNK